MSSAADKQRQSINIWTARCMPIVLAGVVAYATYVLVGPLCVDYLLAKHNDVTAVAVILTIYFILFLLMASSLLRLYHLTVFNPPYVPLGADALLDRTSTTTNRERSSVSDPHNIGGAEYSAGPPQSIEKLGGKEDPDSPGLELFYIKDVFQCERDGKPIWCSHCLNWKPDRAHHCSDAGRCIMKMDHFCPWVGGPVGETNFKFFIQYTAYTALYCLHLLLVMAYYVAQQVQSQDETYNRQCAAVLGVASLFFLFTAGMAGTSIDLAINNTTQVEKLALKNRVHTLAILKPSQAELQRVNPAMASGHNYSSVTYPLNSARHDTTAGAISTGNTSTPMSSATVPLDSANDHTLLEAGRDQAATERSGVRGEGTQLLNNGQISNTDADNQREKETTRSAENSPQAHFSARDMNATRTFAILDMRKGDNPWDLGSHLLNWESVMGTRIIDWFLPIRRSPCCDHEESESQFWIGPWVDLLRSSVGFLPSDEVRAYGGRRRTEHRTAESLVNDEKYHGHKTKSQRRNMELATHKQVSSIQMDDIEQQGPPGPPGST